MYFCVLTKYMFLFLLSSLVSVLWLSQPVNMSVYTPVFVFQCCGWASQWTCQCTPQSLFFSAAAEPAGEHVSVHPSLCFSVPQLSQPVNMSVYTPVFGFSAAAEPAREHVSVHPSLCFQCCCWASQWTCQCTPQSLFSVLRLSQPVNMSVYTPVLIFQCCSWASQWTCQCTPQSLFSVLRLSQPVNMSVYTRVQWFFYFQNKTHTVVPNCNLRPELGNIFLCILLQDF